MNARVPNLPSGVSLLLFVLLLLTPVSTVAGEAVAAEAATASEASFDLGLADAFAELQLAAATTGPLASRPAAEASGPKPATAPLTMKRDPATPPPEPQQSSAAPATRKKGGFGRWLKKHWYVPVLVGVAIGVVVADDNDDDSLGEDD